MDVLGATPVWLDFVDHQYLAPSERADVQDVAAAIEAVIDDVRPTAVFVPMGLANPDHVMTHDAGALLAARRDDLTWFAYEDSGYKHIPGMLAWRVSKLFASELWPTPMVVPAELETPAQIFFEQSGSGLDRGYAALTFARSGRFQVTRRDEDEGTERVQSLYEMGELGLGSNMAFRVAVLRAAGGFDEALGTGTPTRGGEDLAILVELLGDGHRLAYEPAAIVHHTHRATIADLERQIHGYGVGFTAMLTAIALRNPRHLVGLASVIPAWLRSLRDPASAKRANRTPDFPTELGGIELRGMLAGPAAYLRARRMQRRWAA